MWHVAGTSTALLKAPVTRLLALQLSRGTASSIGAAFRRAAWTGLAPGGSGRGCASASALASTCPAAPVASDSKRLGSADLDAWAQGPQVLGHAHSRPSYEPYALSEMRELGRGAAAAESWAARLVSAAGLKNGTSLNQDAYSYTVLDDGWIVCVTCDGHGERGEVISERVARMLPHYLSKLLTTMTREEALRSAFAEAQSDLERCFTTAQIYSGATAAVCCMRADRQEVWFAHAGDSRVLLGDLASGEVVFKTEEHKGHDPEEHQRLQGAGAQVIQKRYADGTLVSRIFIPRTGVPGLAMSRSLGDGCLKKYGVIAEPEIHNVTGLWHSCMAPVVVLASDGLFDYVSVEETISTLSDRYVAGIDVQKGAEVLLRRSQRLWIEAEGDYCDDVTVLLVAPRASLAVS